MKLHKSVTSQKYKLERLQSRWNVADSGLSNKNYPSTAGMYRLEIDGEHLQNQNSQVWSSCGGETIQIKVFFALALIETQLKQSRPWKDASGGSIQTHLVKKKSNLTSVAGDQ